MKSFDDLPAELDVSSSSGDEIKSIALLMSSASPLVAVHDEERRGLMIALLSQEMDFPSFLDLICKS